MATVFTSNLRLALPTVGAESGTWGTTVNNGITTLVDTALTGIAAITMTAADYTLSTANGATDEARCMFITATGTPGAARNIIVPTLSKLYVVYNNTTGGFAQTVKTAAGTGISVPNGARTAVYCDGTNVVSAGTYLSALTLGAALPVASGGTASTTAQGAINTLVGAVTNGQLVQGNGTNIVLAAAPTFNQDTTGYASALKSATTTVSVAAATAPSSGQVLTATGTTAATWQTPTPGMSTGKAIALAMVFGG